MTDRILRIAAFRNNLMISDQTFASAAAVTVGRAEDCSLVLSGLVPERHRLFESQPDGWHLNLVGFMSVRIKHDGVVRQTEAWPEPLVPDDKGVVSMNDVSILFEFVAPVPPAERGPFSFIRRTLQGFRRNR